MYRPDSEYIYIVTETFDGEVNVTPCYDEKSALFIKTELIETLKFNHSDFDILEDSITYFEAEIDSMIYVIDVSMYKIFNYREEM